MHSSRMCTICSSGHISGGRGAVYLVTGGKYLVWGVYLVQGCTWSQGGVCSRGCVPSPGGCTWLGGVPGWGCTWPRGVPGPGGMYLVPGGMYLVQGVHLVWGGVPGPGGVPGWEVYLAGGCTQSQGGLLPGVCTWSWGDVPGLGGVSAPRGVHLVSYSPPCGQTDACKNITFTTWLRTVINALLFL